MKLFQVLKKNFKILFRSKSSALVLLLGPLLIILLVGLAFNNNGSSFSLSIGVYSADYNNATLQFINGLKEKYFITEYYDNESCIGSIKKGVNNICIIFPSDLKLDDDVQDNFDLYIDETRLNLVDTVINKISSVIGGKAKTTSKDLTASLIDTISFAKSEIEQDILKTISSKSKIDSAISDVNSIKSDADSMVLSVGNVGLSDVESGVDTLYAYADSLKTKGLSAIEEALDFIDDLTNVSTNSTESTLNTLKSEINDIDTSTDTAYQDIVSKLSSASDTISDLEANINSANQKKSTIMNSADTVVEELEFIRSNIVDVKSSLESIIQKISSIKVMNADNIVNPVTTTIKPVSTAENKSVYLLPDLLVLVIMFVGIVLSGMSVVLDKISYASFRTFTTPTKDSFFILSYFITNFIIILFQIVFVGAIVVYFLKATIVLSNIYLTLLILVLGISLFTLLGMILGYLLKSQESVTVASLSLASIFLFISNLFIPLESTLPVVRQIAHFNPYVILTDLLKKSIIFRSGFLDLSNELLIILGYMLISFILIVLVQKLSKSTYLNRVHRLKHKSKNLTPEHYFRINSSVVLKNKQDLLNYLKSCSYSDFRYFVDHEENKFVSWLKHILHEKKLARKLKNVLDKDKMIKILEDDIAKTSNSKSFLF